MDTLVEIKKLIQNSFICLAVFWVSACSYSNVTMKLDGKTMMNLDKVLTVAWQDENHLWIGNTEGVARWNIFNAEWERFENSGSCANLTITYNPETVWCDSKKYDGITWEQLDIKPRRIIQTGDGTVWTGTEQGLMRFDTEQDKWLLVLETEPHTVEAFVAEAGNGVYPSLSSSNNYLWFVSSDKPYKGTTYWTRTTHQTFLLREWGNSLMTPKLEANNGAIWASGNDGLVSRWNGHSWQTWRIDFGKTLPPIVEIIEAKSGDIWVRASVDGVGRWDGNNWQTWTRIEGIGNPIEQSRLVLTSMILGGDDNVWVGTRKEGISRWDGKGWRTYTMADGLSSEAITILTKSPEGTLWAGTWGSGVNYYSPDDDRWHPFPDNQ